MEFVYVSDDSGDEALAVSIYSVYHNNQKHDMVFHIIIPIGTKIVQSLMLLQSKKLNYKIYPVDISIYEFVGPSSGHITSATWLKFSIPEFLNADKVLYLDIDTIVIKDLDELFLTDVNGLYPIAGVAPWSDSVPNYLNSGVLLMNTNLLKDRFRIEEIKAAYDSYLGDKSSPWLEQELMNLILKGQIFFINKKYNSHPSDLIFTKNCSILHFYGTRKPWDSYVPFGSKLYNFYYKKVYYNNPIFKTEFLPLILIFVSESKSVLGKTLILILRKLNLYNTIKSMVSK